MVDSTDLPDLALELELEDPRSVKRRRQAQRQEESLVQDPVSAPKSMRPTASDQVIPSRASNEPSLILLDRNRREDAARTPSFPLTVDGNSGGDSAYDCKAGKKLLHFLRQPKSLLETVEQNDELGLDKGGAATLVRKMLGKLMLISSSCPGPGRTG